MNEAVFFLHIIVTLLFSFGALRLGKEALIASASMQAVFANLFVLKQIDFCTLTVTCSDVYAIGGILTLNLLQEFHGKNAAHFSVKCSLFFLVFFAAMAKLHLLYEPSSFDVTHSSYSTILSSAPRILLASLTAFFFSQKIDIFLFAKIKQKLPKAPLAIRNALSMSCSQCFDTMLFTLLGLYGLVDNIWHVFILSFVIKLIVILLSTPLVALSKKFLPSPEPTA
jgi:uncharacterized integral membrane protein (TIGR00697 family)